MSTVGAQSVSRFLNELTCVWIGVSNLDRAAFLLGDRLGLKYRDEGLLINGMGGSSIAQSRRWILFSSTHESAGQVCLFASVARPRSGRLPRGWDAVEAVVADIDGSAAVLAECEDVEVVHRPFTADLTAIGGNVHRSGIWRMPWGTHLILTMGLTAPLEREFPSTRESTGRVFEVHLRTDKFWKARAFYTKALGMPTLFDLASDRGPIHEAWSIMGEQVVRMSFMKSGGRGTGRGAIELQGHPPGMLERSAIYQASRFGGTAMVTFSSQDLDGLAAAAGGAVVGAATVLNDGPFAGRRSLLLVGAESELVQVVDGGADGWN